MSSDLSGRPLGAWYGGIYVGEVDGGVYILIIIRPTKIGEVIVYDSYYLYLPRVVSPARDSTDTLNKKIRRIRRINPSIRIILDKKNYVCFDRCRFIPKL